MKLTELICQAIKEENEKKGIKVECKPLGNEPTKIDDNGREHSIEDGRFVRE